MHVYRLEYFYDKLYPDSKSTSVVLLFRLIPLHARRVYTMKRIALFGALILTLALPLTVRSADDTVGKSSAPVHPTSPVAKQVETQVAVPPAQPSVDAAKEKVMLLTGRVVQIMNSGGYTYVYLDNKGEKNWVAAPEMQVKVGEELTFQGGGEMRNFASKSLNRTFEKIFFCGSPIPRAGDAVDITAGKRSPGGKVMAAKDETIKVGKASGPNAYTIGNLYRNKARLDKKKVVVRGKVVKVSARIMERNWVHIQDGSGEAKKKTNNLVVTSTDLPSVGDIVTASGVIVKDRDFGSGYKYDLILEQATIKTEK
jgi:hypothetical protein